MASHSIIWVLTSTCMSIYIGMIQAALRIWICICHGAPRRFIKDVLLYKGTSLWNKLPPWVKKSTFLNDFKHNFRLLNGWIHPEFIVIFICTHILYPILTHWGRDKWTPFRRRQFQMHFLKISLKFVPKGPINNVPAMVQIMAWRRPGGRPLSEPVVVTLPTHICIVRPQWVNGIVLSILFTASPIYSYLEIISIFIMILLNV